MTQEEAFFAMGCFWGAQRLFDAQDGVIATEVGYMGGHTSSPTYKQVCSDTTGHAETVRVIYDSARISFAELCRVFFEHHDPTQLNRQGPDRGSQYRSAIFPTTSNQERLAHDIREKMNEVTINECALPVVTEIYPVALHTFFPAEEYHQHYLEKNPQGYCGIRNHGMSCPV